MQHSRRISDLFSASVLVFIIACALLVKPAYAEKDYTQHMQPVSYTHLTLPTIYTV